MRTTSSTLPILICGFIGKEKGENKGKTGPLQFSSL